MIANDEDVYQELRKHLDKAPIGYPATDSGVEIRLLKFFFSPEEAKIALKMKPNPEPLKKIHRRLKKTGITIEQLEQKLDEMYIKGSISSAKIEQDDKIVKYYLLVPLAVGMYEYQLKRLTPQFIRDVEQYFEESFVEEAVSTRINQLRQIPVEKALTVEHTIAKYDDVTKWIKDENITNGKIAIMDCVCCKSKEIIGEPCKQSDNYERCMTFGKAAESTLRKGWSRQISPNEALELLRNFDEIGLVPEPGNSQSPMYMCNCCGCCCGMLTNLKKLGFVDEVFATNYYSEVDPELCVGCETCVDRCQMGAITVEDKIAIVNKKLCLGCGLCVTTCPSDAIKLRNKEEKYVPAEDTFAMYNAILNKKAEINRAKKSQNN
jgi:ferredoxin